MKIAEIAVAKKAIAVFKKNPRDKFILVTKELRTLMLATGGELRVKKTLYHFRRENLGAGVYKLTLVPVDG